jgi:hypothetical protein
MKRAVLALAVLAGCSGASAPRPPDSSIRGEEPGGERAAWCNDARTLAATLKRDFAETPAASGLGLNGLILEIFASAGGRTFSLIVIHPLTNRACVVFAGVGWSLKKPGREI